MYVSMIPHESEWLRCATVYTPEVAEATPREALRDSERKGKVCLCVYVCVCVCIWGGGGGVSLMLRFKYKIQFGDAP